MTKSIGLRMASVSRPPITEDAGPEVPPSRLADRLDARLHLGLNSAVSWPYTNSTPSSTLRIAEEILGVSAPWRKPWSWLSSFHGPH
ncbi:MAG: hypothetical protein JWO62_1004 [Acidimicrobiaceae bacterium]|nr:hypothetical protein [Acidimicrobiaceae bacterium]